jgi:hypothetical protein
LNGPIGPPSEMRCGSSSSGDHLVTQEWHI